MIHSRASPTLMWIRITWDIVKLHSLINGSGMGLEIHFFPFFLQQYLWHMEVPRLGAESELQLQAYATPTALPDPSHICANGRLSLHQHRILNPLSKARDQTCILKDNLLSRNGNSCHRLLYLLKNECLLRA